MSETNYTLSKTERDLFQSFHRRLAEAQAAIQHQYIGALLALIAARGLADIPGGYRLSDDGTAIVPAQEPPATKAE